MCGLSGTSSLRHKEKLKQLTRDIISRGPDETSFYNLDWIQIGFNRLAIVDLLNGSQPFFSSDKRFAVFCNGEIYNHKLLRNDLEKSGTRFISDHADIEVIAHGFERWGLDVFSRLDGMFAVAVIDQKEKALYLCRDACGERPLFYYLDDQKGITFCSEFRPLLKMLGSFHPDGAAWRWFLGTKAPPFGASMDGRIRQIPPRNVLIWRGGMPSMLHWANKSRSSHVKSKSLDENVEQLDHLIQKSVGLRKCADVEIGAYLSGGLDSSLITVLASKALNKKIKTYSLVYDEEIYNKNADRYYAKQISDEINTEHREIHLNPSKIIQDLPKIVRQYGQPTSLPCSTWFVSEVMGEDIKVALTGDGPDELFGSYFLHRVCSLLDYKERHGVCPKNAVNDPAAIKFAARNRKASVSEMFEGFSVFDSKEQEELLGIEIPAAPSFRDQLDVTFGQRKKEGQSRLQRILEFEWKRLFNEGVLHYADVLSMAHSVENRLPYLSKEILDMAREIPDEQKCLPGETKRILKRVALRHLPENIVNRPKEGFIEPSIYWLSGPLWKWTHEYFKRANERNLGFINWSNVPSLEERFKRTKELAIGKKIWTLLNIAMWEEENAL